MKASPIPSVKFRGSNEVSAFVFAVEGRSVPAQAPGCIGAADADARGKAEPRAAAAGVIDLTASHSRRHSGAREVRAMMCNCTSENPYSRPRVRLAAFAENETRRGPISV